MIPRGTVAYKTDDEGQRAPPRRADVTDPAHFCCHN
jgi:hypothetical protein